MDCNWRYAMSITSRKFTITLTYFAVLIALLSCVSAPVQEMSDARQAIQAARESNPDGLTQENLVKAESLLKEAEAALENGEYKKARLTATEARNEAIKAQRASP